MNRTKSGAILLGVGILMNVIGRLIPQSDTPSIASVLAIWMIASLVIGLFGLFRLIAGATRKDT